MLFFLNSFHVFSQKGKDTYNTKINNANTVIIKNGKVTIGQIIINQNLNSKIFLTNQTRTVDSIGQIRTELTFKNPDNMFYFL